MKEFPISDLKTYTVFHRFRHMMQQVEDADFLYKEENGVVRYSGYGDDESSIEECECDEDDVSTGACTCEMDAHTEKHDPLIPELIAYMCDLPTSTYVRTQMDAKSELLFKNLKVWYTPLFRKLCLKKKSTSEYFCFDLHVHDNGFEYGVGGFSRDFSHFTFTDDLFHFVQLLFKAHPDVLCSFVADAVGASIDPAFDWDKFRWFYDTDGKCIMVSYNDGFDIFLYHQHILVKHYDTESIQFPISIDRLEKVFQKQHDDERRNKRKAKIRQLLEQREKFIGRCMQYGMADNDREVLEAKIAFCKHQRRTLAKLKNSSVDVDAERTRRYFTLFKKIVKP